MPSFVFSTSEEFNGTRFGSRIVQLVSVLGLPLPCIKGLQLKKFERKDLWGFKVSQPGLQSEPPIEEIAFKIIHDDKEKGLDVAMQELLGRLCGHHSAVVKASTFISLGDSTRRERR
jgi:hypothetical protein